MAAGKEAQQSTPVYLGALLDAGEGATMTLVVGETRLVAHRAILVAGSAVFTAMFRHDTAESGSGLVDITDVNRPVLKELPTYMYTLRAPQLASLAPQLLVAADKYGVASLKAQCEQQLATVLTVENAAATGVLVVRHWCPGLRQTTVSFVKGHMYQVMSSGCVCTASAQPCVAIIEVSRLLAETPPELSPGAAPRHTTTPPDDAAISRLQSLSEEEMGGGGGMLIEVAKEGVTEELSELLVAGAKSRSWWIY
ncbi:speckle-type POZ protein-like [Schistocerca serialis cubense]|uniref:speckle-type POZ protein-like n=1 Tax=Schistocerca serialis cubense TaxID=2023355 RepID=UPI00214E72F7|nr:speckle-type POZ protein-like [Schistocerca serialis cubense]